MIDLLLCIAYILIISTALYYANKSAKLKEDLDKKVHENFEFIKEKLKCKKLYKVDVTCEMGKKCKYCDENRMITLTYPDGTTKKENCKCRENNVRKVKIEEYGLKSGKEYGFCFSNKNIVRIYLYDEDWSYNIIRTQKDYEIFMRTAKNRLWVSDTLFGSKKLAKQYANFLKGKYK